MYNVVQNGTGARAQLDGIEVAGKTGTTQAARDAWFMGFTADYVAGVWMGYDDNTPLTGVTGSGLPAEIWHETMTRVMAGLDPKPLPMIRPSEPPLWAPSQTLRNQGQGNNKTMTRRTTCCVICLARFLERGTNPRTTAPNPHKKARGLTLAPFRIADRSGAVISTRPSVWRLSRPIYRASHRFRPARI